jgi:hypothetical protein
LWALPKNCSTKGGGFDLKSFGRELVEGKKCYSKPLIEILMVG